jgi:hypothetical protein
MIILVYININFVKNSNSKYNSKYRIIMEHYTEGGESFEDKVKRVEARQAGLKAYNDKILHQEKIDRTKKAVRGVRRRSKFINSKWAYLLISLLIIVMIVLAATVSKLFLICIPFILITLFVSQNIINEKFDKKVNSLGNNLQEIINFAADNNITEANIKDGLKRIDDKKTKDAALRAYTDRKLARSNAAHIEAQHRAQLNSNLTRYGVSR